MCPGLPTAGFLGAGRGRGLPIQDAELHFTLIEPRIPLACQLSPWSLSPQPPCLHISHSHFWFPGPGWEGA